MIQTVEPHVRYCYGCGKHDDAPRVHDIDDATDPGSKLYHYDCVPQHITDGEKLHPDTVEFIGTYKDDDLRERIVSAAKVIPAPEPDDQPHLKAAGYTQEQIDAHVAAAMEG